MKKFKSIKTVEAAKIVNTSVGGHLGGRKLHLDDGTTFNATYEMELRYTAKIGDWLVKYDDEYYSISPAKAFENGYVEIE